MSSPASFKILVSNGMATMIYADAHASFLQQTGAEITRASHVEPVKGGWTADMSPMGGPELTDNGKPFLFREEALKAECEWLDKHIFKL